MGRFKDLKLNKVDDLSQSMSQSNYLLDVGNVKKKQSIVRPKVPKALNSSKSFIIKTNKPKLTIDVDNKEGQFSTDNLLSNFNQSNANPRFRKLKSELFPIESSKNPIDTPKNPIDLEKISKKVPMFKSYKHVYKSKMVDKKVEPYKNNISKKKILKNMLEDPFINLENRNGNTSKNTPNNANNSQFFENDQPKVIKK